VIVDAAVGAIMEEVDLCLVGAEGVMENGGIVNKVPCTLLISLSYTRPFYTHYSDVHTDVLPVLPSAVYPSHSPPLNLSCFATPLQIGTYQIALVAKALQVPFYVAVESYKFSRMYPLSQRDVSELSALPESHPPSSTTGPNSLSSLAFSRTPSFGAMPSTPSKVKRSFTDLASALPANVTVEQLNVDFTPAKCITLLFTDIGVLTPAAVSDELIRMYQ
jgi:translation initiation factor eIF-2B subunit alpha